jgi:hypothetical protein
MSLPKGDTVLNKEAELETYKAFLFRCGHDVDTAIRKMRTAQARHVEHYGQATAQEMRDLWEDAYPHGPTKRPVIPDQYALVWALAESTNIYGEDALETAAPGMDEFDCAGLHAGFRKHLVGKFEPYVYEVLYQVQSGRLYNRARLGRFIQSLLPGMAARAQSLDDMQKLAGILRRLPAWVWEETPVGAGQCSSVPVEAEQCPALLAEAEDRVAAAARRPSSGDAPVAGPEDDCATAAPSPLELCQGGVGGSPLGRVAPSSPPRPRKRAIARRR